LRGAQLIVAPGRLIVRLEVALEVQMPLIVLISLAVPLTVCKDPPDAVPVNVPW
jgi:hypothetical protein